MKRLPCFLATLLILLPATPPALSQEGVKVYEDVTSLTGCDAMRKLATRIPKECVKKKKYDTSVLGTSRAADFRSMIAKKLATPATEEWVNNTPSGGFSTRVLQFDVNSTSLNPEGRELLYEVETVMMAEPNLVVRIEGHTDSTGSEEVNQRLSERRVAAVIAQFQGGFRSRLIGVGLGESRPLPNLPSTDAYNRRVEIIRVEPAAASH